MNTLNQNTADSDESLIDSKIPRIPCRNVVKINLTSPPPPPAIQETPSQDSFGGDIATSSDSSDDDSDCSFRVVEITEDTVDPELTTNTAEEAKGGRSEVNDIQVIKYSASSQLARPPIDKQIGSILLLLKQYNTLAAEVKGSNTLELNNMSIMYIIQAQWLDCFFNGLNTVGSGSGHSQSLFGPDSDSDISSRLSGGGGGQSSRNSYQTALGPIDNTSLLSAESLEAYESDGQNEGSKSATEGVAYKLRENAELNTDFYLIPSDCYTTLSSWYGVKGPVFVRIPYSCEKTTTPGTDHSSTEFSKIRPLGVSIECSVTESFDGARLKYSNVIEYNSPADFESFIAPTTPMTRQEVDLLIEQILSNETDILLNNGAVLVGGDNHSESAEDLLLAYKTDVSKSASHDMNKSVTKYASCSNLHHHTVPATTSGDHHNSLQATEGIVEAGAEALAAGLRRNNQSFNSHFTNPSAHQTQLTAAQSVAYTTSCQYCFVCHKTSAVLRCSKCASIIYCSRDCQVAHWQYHKLCCPKLRDIVSKKNITNYYYSHPRDGTDDDLDPLLKKSGTTTGTATAEGKDGQPTATTTAAAVTKSKSNMVLFNRNKNNLRTLDDWKTAPLSKTDLSYYYKNQNSTYMLYGRSGKVGLMNLGNSCYMNSSIQCLSHIMPLTTYMLSQKYKPEINYMNRDGTKGQLIESYYALLSNLWFESKAAVSPKEFKTLLGRINPEYAGLQQQDAHEVIELLLDKYHEDLNRIQGAKPYTTKVEGDGTNDSYIAHETMRLHKTRDDSIVHDTVGSLMRSQLTCPDCGKVSVSYEFHNTVQLAIPKTNNRTFRVIFVPEYDKTVADSLAKGTTTVDAGVERVALRPQAYTITLDKLMTVRALKAAVMKLIPEEFLEYSGNMVHMFESDGTQRSLLIRLLKDSHYLSTVTEGAIIYAYCPSVDFDMHTVIYQRTILPRYSPTSIPTGTDSDVEPTVITANHHLYYIGVPIMVSFQSTWHTARVRHRIWENVCCLFSKEKSGFEQGKSTFLGSLFGTNTIEQFALCKRLSLRQVDNTGRIMPVKGYRSVDSSNELGAELPFDKDMTLGQFTGTKADILFFALDLVGDAEAQYDFDFYAELTKPLPPPMGSSKVAQSPRNSSNSNSQNAQPIEAQYTLYDCLKEHTKEETLDAGNEWFCNVCKEHKAAKKVVTFASQYLPSVLILSLKRFEFRDIGKLHGMGGGMGGMMGGGGGMMHREKIYNHIDFPIDSLDLAPYCEVQQSSDGDEEGQGGLGVGGDGLNFETDTTEGVTKATRGLSLIDDDDDDEDNSLAPGTVRDPNNLRVSPAKAKGSQSAPHSSGKGGNGAAAVSLSQSKVIGSTVYDLFAVCNHFGRMGFGHYTAVAREWNIAALHATNCSGGTVSGVSTADSVAVDTTGNDSSFTGPEGSQMGGKSYHSNSLSDVWYTYDDNSVTECKNINEIQSSSAYILFYRRRALDSDSNSGEEEKQE